MAHPGSHNRFVGRIGAQRQHYCSSWPKAGDVGLWPIWGTVPRHSAGEGTGGRESNPPHHGCLGLGTGPHQQGCSPRTAETRQGRPSPILWACLGRSHQINTVHCGLRGRGKPQLPHSQLLQAQISGAPSRPGLIRPHSIRAISPGSALLLPHRFLCRPGRPGRIAQTGTKGILSGPSAVDTDLSWCPGPVTGAPSQAALSFWWTIYFP